MKFIRAAAFLLCLSAVFYGNAAEKPSGPPPQPRRIIRLDGRPETGRTVFFSYRASGETRYQLKLRGAKKNPPDRRETLSVMLSGELTFLPADEGAVAYSLKLNAVDVKKNGLPVKKAASGAGHVCRITVTEKAFQAEYADAQNDLLSLTPRAGGADNVMPEELREVLRQIFGGSPGGTPSVWFGAARLERAVGEDWALDAAWLRASLTKRGIESAANQFDARAFFKGSKELMGVPVFQLKLKIQTFGVPGYTCSLEAAFDIPEKMEGNPGPLHWTSEASEVVDRLMPEDNPIFSGTKFQVTRLNSMEISLLPKD